MTSFFISYTKVDRPWAEWIAQTLEDAGHNTRIQAWDFRPGNNFVLEMQQAAVEADRTVAVLSPDYLKSLFAMSEWAAAFAQDPGGERGTLLPVRVRDVVLDGIMAPIVYVDLVNLSEEAAREALVRGLAQGRIRPVGRIPFPGRVGFPGGQPSSSGGTPSKELPTDRVPEPGPLPAGSRMQHPSNPMFVGRDAPLLQLARMLKAGEATALGQAAVVAGLGGVGKTQLACEFAHRYGRYFEGGVFWMSFAVPESIPAEVAACGNSLDLHPNFGGFPLEQQVRLVREAWQRALPRLLVFDNCEDPRLLDEWRPTSGSCRLLVTSRRSQWDPAFGVKLLPLSTLLRSASIELLHKFRNDIPDTDPALDQIAEELGDLPLALHLAGSFLARYRSSPFGQPGAYVEQLRRGDLLAHPSLRGREVFVSPTDHDVSVGRTFALSAERLDPGNPTDALARKLLNRTAYFACGEPIPRHLLFATLQLQPDDLETSIAAEDALGKLLSLGLLESGEDGRIVLHRLVAAFVRGGGVETLIADRSSVEKTLQEEAERINASGYPAPLLAWQPHLRAVVDSALGREEEMVGELCSELGFHLSMVGDAAGARSYFERALAIFEKVLGPENPTTVTSLNNLGEVLRKLGELEGARSYYERALAIREKDPGPEDPKTAISLGNLGTILRALGDISGAKVYHERALTIFEKTLGPDDPETALSLNSLGLVLRDLGDLPGALGCHEKALRIFQAKRGKDHPDTALSFNNLGFVLERMGRSAEARENYQKALEIREKALGPEHPSTKITRGNLARLDGEGAEAGGDSTPA